MFLKSIRDPNFDLFVRTLKEILPWTFALDHIHYARWLSVFVNDLCYLSKEHPDVFEQFISGFFTVKKSTRQFSNIGIDQAHEQNNKKVKVDGGAVGIFDNESALLDWSVAGPVIADILGYYFDENDEISDVVELPNTAEYDDSDNTDGLQDNGEPGAKRKHHESTEKFENTFVENRGKLLSFFFEVR